MTNSVIFTKTTKGFAELSHKTVHLPRQYYEVLQAIDGRSDPRHLQNRMDEISGTEFEGILRYLLGHGLIKPLSSGSEGEQFDLQAEGRILVDELDPEDGVRAWAEARRGAAELKEKGYFKSTNRTSEVREIPEILVVEDDPVIARMELKLLQNGGFKTRHADCEKEMQVVLADWKPDLLTLDVRLPDANGFAILRWLRAHPDFCKLPIIMVTAETEAEDLLQGLHGGADGYIFKPFQAEALIQCIRKVLNI